jgi:futalosine hydrolase
MRILVVAATATEVAAMTAKLQPVGEHLDEKTTRYTCGSHEVDVLLTGVGMVATAVWCARALSQRTYDLALNLGVCGSFDRALEPGGVVHVTTDRLAELGAEDGDSFITIQELQLVGANEFPFTDGRLVNAAPPANAVLQGLPIADGITVSTAHGDERSIAAVCRRFRPQVESMEGAAFMYACLVQRIPFAQVRAVSNDVERRNRAAWKLVEAASAVGQTGLRVLETL